MNVLITNYFIRNYTGSEINALQLCNALKNLGINADVATFFFDEPLKQIFEENDITVKILFNAELELEKYDLIWAHHIHTINHLIFHHQLESTKIIYSCLGPFSPLAVPPYYHNELNSVLSNSEGNTSVLLAEGVAREKIHYFPNYAPQEFFKQYKASPSTSLHKVGIISNHPPSEIQDFTKLARDSGLQVDIIGAEGQRVYVTPSLLNNFDAIISIGKTVQYCFALKIPVYCYDHFGGPGYITKENLPTSQYYNFSGRGIGRKLSGKELFNDITHSYPSAISSLDFLYEYSAEHFMLEKNIEVLLGKLSTQDKVDINAVREKFALTKRHHMDFLETLMTQIKLQEQLFGKWSGNSSTRSHQQEISELHQEILSYALSKSWRLTRPFRKFMNIFRKNTHV